MSFSNYEQFQGQQPNEDPSAGAPAGGPGGPPGGVQAPQQQPPPMGQQPGASPAPFNGGNGPHPGSSDNDQPGGDSKTTLWMGELEPWIDENFVRSVWFGLGEQVNVKMIRDKFSGSNAGYCFVDFTSSAAAAKALTLNGTLIPNSQRPFKLNWASGGGLSDRRYFAPQNCA